MSHRSPGVNARRRAWDAALLAIAALGSWLLARFAVSADVDAAVIPTLTMLAVRHFKRGKEDGEREPKHPAVKFVLGAWNEGDFSEAEKYVAPGCAIYTNGFAYDSGSEGGGPALAKESVEYWRALVPDLAMELTQEIREKDRIAIEWLITGTHTGELPELPASGNAIELQGSAFLTLEDDKIVEAWTVFERACSRSPDRSRRGAGLVAGSQLSIDQYVTRSRRVHTTDEWPERGDRARSPARHMLWG